MKKRNVKNKGKKDADYKLATEQFAKLNQDFYNGFLVEFYGLKLTNLMGVISSTKEFAQFLSKSKLKIGEGELDFTEGPDSEKKFKEYAQLELAMTYYHCLETFVRIFIAHSKISECPWLELSRLSVNKYKEWLIKLSNNKFDSLNNVINGDETVLWVFTGNTNLAEQMTQKDLEGLKEWIRWSATELLETFDYNSFKHGLAISAKPVGIRLGAETDKFKLEKRGDALTFITRTEKETRYVWNTETLWIPYDSRAAIIWTINMLIKNIFAVGKCLHLKEPLLSNWLPNNEWSPSVLLKSREANDLGLSVKGFRQELLYYK